MIVSKTKSALGRVLAALACVAAMFGAAVTLSTLPALTQQAIAAESALTVPAASSLTQIGEVDGDPVYYYEADQACESVDLSAFGSFGTDAMIASINSNHFVADASTVAIAPYTASEDEIRAEFTLDQSAVSGLDLASGTYAFWMMNDDFEVSYLVLKMPEKAAAGCANEAHDPGFTVTSANGLHGFKATHTANAYVYDDYYKGQVKVCLFTVKVPQGTTHVTIKAEKPSLFYNYQDGSYLAGWVDDATKGEDQIVANVDSNADSVMDCIQVQDPYNADWTGGDLRYAITFQEVPQAAAAVDLDQLIANVAKRFTAGNPNADVDNNTWAAAIALNAMGKGSLLDVQAILGDLLESENYLACSAGQLGKYIMVLTSAGVDCTKVTAANGQSVDLVAAMKAKVKVKESVDGGKAIDEWSAPCIVPVFGCCGYSAAGFETYLQGMIQTMAGKVPTIYGYEYDGKTCVDVMSACQAILALQPYAQGNEELEKALKTAKIELLKLLREDGSFPTQWGNGVDDTALAYAALKALGATDQELYTVQGSNPLNFLASKANATVDGFSVTGNEAMSASSALLAFAAHQVDGTPYVAKKPVEVAQSISGKSAWKVTYGAKPFSLGATAKTALSYKSSNTKVVTVSSKGVVSVKRAGKATITISAKAAGGYQAATKKVTVTVAKKAQTLKVSTARKAAVRGGYTKAVKLSGNKTARSFAKVGGSKYLTVTDYGKIKVSSKAKRGATYTIKVKVKLRETVNYKAAVKTVTLKVKAL